MSVTPPFAILAELTHRCPLRCLYCSNPLDLVTAEAELTTNDWARVFDEAATLGVLQVGLSGGEPLVRPDLEVLVRTARNFGLYTNLITSGVGLSTRRAQALASAGLHSLQLSIQAADVATADAIAGVRVTSAKENAAVAARDAGIPLSMNVVLHRTNIADLEAIVRRCAAWGARRLELANAQYYGWALANRPLLLPDPEQVRQAEQLLPALRAEVGAQMDILWVLADYLERYPKPCMGGWANKALTIAPDGRAYPCPVAKQITTLTFPSVFSASLRAIWYDDPAFQAYRGQEWMQEPCRSCDRRELDLGGCRCQAFTLTGDAANADPVCHKSVHRSLVDRALATTAGPRPVTPRYRVRITPS